jgi:hypothetical protein
VGQIANLAEFEMLHACADETMYAAKRNGGNRIALAGAVDGDTDHEIPFRPTSLKEQSEIDAESLGH